ncbi:STAS domain-containing protein [Inmirania thermothiophila]|uniref:Anti-anti-sigma factor n=1 Tax=Inmirania thermothiophila TaxID=1750597 RepID=A0A3N1Y8L2_9GAMM|nr:STAS domain-containing protein [Inmirania thermothiophila]ROR35154.1 anti-anti-sigma factor [Inmirania thermothiophila]
MPLTSSVSEDGKVVTIAVSGRFDFNLHREFREAYEQAPAEGVRYVVDLAGTEYIDSSALGMLLLLRERAGGDQADVEIRNCSPEIKRILTISNFHHLFKIS